MIAVLPVLCLLGGLWLGWWARGQGIVVPTVAPVRKVRLSGENASVVDVDKIVENPYDGVRERMIEDFVAGMQRSGQVVDREAIAADVDLMLQRA